MSQDRKNYNDFDSFMNQDTFFDNSSSSGGYDTQYNNPNSDYGYPSYGDNTGYTSQTYDYNQSQSNDPGDWNNYPDNFNSRPMTYEDNKNYYVEEAQKQLYTPRENDFDPDGRIATRGDGIKALIGYILIGIIISAAGIFAFILSSKQAEITREFFENADQVSGTIVDTKKNVNKTHRRKGGTRTTTTYYLQVNYQYGGIDYTSWSESISSGTFNRYNLSQTGSIGRTITTYVDTRNPSSIRVVYDPDAKPLYIVLLFPCFGVLAVVAGVKFMIDCSNGKYYIIKRGGKTKYRKIKMT